MALVTVNDDGSGGRAVRRRRLRSAASVEFWRSGQLSPGPSGSAGSGRLKDVALGGPEDAARLGGLAGAVAARKGADLPHPRLALSDRGHRQVTRQY